jgi:hypothetical protein
MNEFNFEGFLRECRALQNDTPSQALIKEAQHFYAIVEEQPALLGELSFELANLPYVGAGWLAVVIGTCIEQGKNAESSYQQVLALFLSWLQKIEEFADIENDDCNLPDELQPIHNALPRLCQSLVTHLANLPHQRAELAQNDEIFNRLEQLESLNAGISWVFEALKRSSGSLVILHPESGKGFNATYNNISSCFHLFSLIQCAIGEKIADGKTPNEEVIEAATTGQTDEAVQDSAWWHYGSPLANKPDFMASIWGEASVKSIPSVNGVQVILLWSPLLGNRSWDSGFFMPHLYVFPPSITLDAELNPTEIHSWLTTLHLNPPASPKKRPWWKLI